MTNLETIPEYEMVSTKAHLKRILKYIRDYDRVAALDFETTSLKPEEGRVRLASICNDSVTALVDFDQIGGGFRGCAKMFAEVEWVVFNAGFELRWFMDAGAPRTVCWDLAYLRKARIGGGGFSLKLLIKWLFEVDLDKTEQAGEWGNKVLTQSQLDYAYMDAEWTWRAWNKVQEGLTTNERHNLFDGFHMFNDMVPGVIEMEDTGILLDQAVHKQLIKAWERQKATRVKIIRKMVALEEVRNINSDAQWSDYFSRHLPDAFLDVWPRTPKGSLLSMKKTVLSEMAGAVPGTPLEEFFDALSDYKTVTKYLTSFGQPLLDKARAEEDGRVRARYNIGQARTGRFSSSGLIQQMPRDRELLGTYTSVRSSFIAAPGMDLVSLDYSGIELRVLALLADDEQLLEDCIYGDVHSEVAASVAGAPIDKTTRIGKAMRQSAKAVSFGIIYGSAAGGLALTLRCSDEDAQGHIDFWMERYPKAFNYRNVVMAEAVKTTFISCAGGGTIYMGKHLEMPKIANYPVQRAALAVMAKAIARHKATLDAYRHEPISNSIRMVSTIHDALIDEAPRTHSGLVLGMMKNDMELGLLDIFPGASIENLVEGGVGPSWGALE